MTARNRVQVGLIGLAAGLALSLALVPGGGRAVAAAGPGAMQGATPPPTPQQQAPPAQGRGVQSGQTPGAPGRIGPSGSVRDPFPEWEWWKDDAVKRELGLTDKVSADIDTFYQHRLREVTPFVDEWRKQSDQLNQMTQERKVDESTFAVQVARVEALSSRLRESRAVMLYHIYLKLTPEQFSKLPDIRMRHFQRGRGGSPR